MDEGTKAMFRAWFERLEESDKKEIRSIVTDKLSVALPDWLPKTLWDEWQQHRREIRKPLKPTQVKAQIARLLKFRQEGHEPADVIRNSIAGGYQGLFAPGRRVNGINRINGTPRESVVERAYRLNGFGPI